MRTFNWILALVILATVGLATVLLTGVVDTFIPYLYFALSILHSQWLNDVKIDNGGT